LESGAQHKAIGQAFDEVWAINANRDVDALKQVGAGTHAPKLLARPHYLPPEGSSFAPPVE
jgi:hypothetical protein